ncbi:bacillithiol system redox-active protein YtxJ [Laceyella sacchari]|jgi:bacillithiol system protein YtxJ|uniref:Bacillithiol system redox-active protein YtxJ n=1 Tax=Laceyella sacchari TaxID=37482 RepID=A0ABY5U1I3_LACSH|nr:bacillithiol system redox-active protein YtxJ [Laceyella sacchari]UWE03034.1 bacillithiol system redox-active protein YtxJ [Laceyella sacchari]
MEKPARITSVEQLDEWMAKAGKRPLLLFKHSTSCPISAAAYGEWEAFLSSDAATEVLSAAVFVIEDRPLSNEIAERFGIKHESPQALFVIGDEVKWHASHWNITKQALTDAVQSL